MAKSSTSDKANGQPKWRKTSSKPAPSAKAKRLAQQGVSVDRLRRLLRARGESLVSLPNVTSVGIGYKLKDGKRSDELAVQFSVSRKIAPEGPPACSTSASGYALRALKTLKTYTTPGDISHW